MNYQINYEELISDLNMFKDRPLMARSARAIEELLDLNQRCKEEIARLNEQIKVLKMSDEEKIQDIKEGIRCVYRRLGSE